MSSHILFFDTQQEAEAIHCRLIFVGQEHPLCRVPFTAQEAQSLLSMVVKSMQERGLTLRDLSAIAVLQGATRFTIARVAVVVANAIGWSLQIPVLSYTQQPSVEQLQHDAPQHRAAYQPIAALYSKEPTMTLR